MITISGGGGSRVKSRQSGKIDNIDLAVESIFFAPVVYKKSEFSVRLIEYKLETFGAGKREVGTGKSLENYIAPAIKSNGMEIELNFSRATLNQGQSDPKVKVVWELIEYE